MKDKYSVERIASLHPLVRDIFTDFINTAETVLDITLRITQGYRSFAFEDALYEQGRNTPGKIVTNAKGGQSFHNYGLAIDVAEVINDCTTINWGFNTGQIVPFATNLGLTWGGNWHTIKDYPHFQKDFGLTWQQLLALHNEGKVDDNGYVIIETPKTTPALTQEAPGIVNDNTGGADPMDM